MPVELQKQVWTVITVLGHLKEVGVMCYHPYAIIVTVLGVAKRSAVAPRFKLHWCRGYGPHATIDSNTAQLILSCLRCTFFGGR